MASLTSNHYSISPFLSDKALTRNAVNKLAEQLVISSADAQAARDFVEKALSGEVYITIDEKTDVPTYYLLGNSLSLLCKIGDTSGRKFTHFLVTSLAANIPPHEFERRRQASYHVQTRWRIGGPGEPIPTIFESLSGLLDQIDDFFRSQILEIKKRERRLDLVESWRSLLSLDREIQTEGTTQIHYLSWEPINKNAVLKVRLARQDGASETESFPVGELLQMTSKKRRPIRVGHCLSQDANSLLISRLPDLSLDNIASTGTLTIDDSQWAAAWGRQRAALDVLLDGRSQNPRLPELLLAPANATYLLQETVETYFNKDLDEAKRDAVNAALSARDLYLIQGPPGTGKTILIAEIITQILSQHLDTKVLLVSQSNVAADHVLLALTELLAASSIDRDIVRVGREAAVSSEMKSHLITSQLDAWTYEIKQACNAYLLGEHSVNKKE